MNIRVYYEDTDSGGIVYHANYIKYCERARSEIFFNSDIHPFNDECNFVVSSLQAKFIKPAHLGDMLCVKTEVTNIKGASIELKQEIYRTSNLKQNGLNELIFSANIVVVCLCKSKPKRLDKEIIQFFKSISER